MYPKEIRAAIDALPAQIKVHVTRGYLGHLFITPVEAWVRDLVRVTNQHDGRTDVYIDVDTQIAEFIEEFPEARSGLEMDNEVEFMLDSWRYRHLVGGQSD